MILALKERCLLPHRFKNSRDTSLATAARISVYNWLTPPLPKLDTNHPKKYLIWLSKVREI